MTAAEPVSPPASLSTWPSSAVKVATSAEPAGFTVYADDREGAEKAARTELARWLGPHVTLEFRDVP